MAPINKVLVANRAEIASRVFRSARRLGIATVAIHSDADAGLPYVAEADEAVHLPGVEPRQTYLDIGAVIDAATRTAADAIHPGYGFLSERADFARACATAGITFIGPSPDAIERVGSKIEAKATMAAAGVPVLPGLTIEDVLTNEQRREIVEHIGLPVIVKAALGGGGRGMRIVHGVDSLDAAVGEAQREAAAAFGSSQVFIERYVDAPRHVEVQIFGDHFGTVVHLFERECSIQRRHQKVIEEAPSPGIDESTRAELGAAAVAAAKAIGYVNAGTVEFVLDRDGRFWFLEVNTRLQVEHPVTEAVTGLDLVDLQFRVAAGERLPDEVLDATIRGHAIEARLYAEDVHGGYLPVSGPVHRISLDDTVRVDAGYADGSVVSTYYDAMLAKVIAWAPTRAEAATTLAAALERAALHGVVTNRGLLVATLRHPEFLAGHIDTDFLDRHDLAVPERADELLHAHARAATAVLEERSFGALPVPPGIPKGWRNVGPPAQPWRFDIDGAEVVVDPASVDASVGVDGTVTVRDQGAHRRFALHVVDDVVYVDSGASHATLRILLRFPAPGRQVVAGSLVAPVPGTVVRVLVEAGDAVDVGDALVVIEAMKMEHTVTATSAGTVRAVAIGVGGHVDTGEILLQLDDGEP